MEIKIKGILNIKIIDTRTGKVIDEINDENTDTLVARIYAGYIWGSQILGFITEDIRQWYDSNLETEKLRLTFDVTNIQTIVPTSFHASRVSSTQYQYSFQYNATSEVTIYGITLYGNPVEFSENYGNNKPVFYTIYVLPEPRTLLPNYVLVGRYILHFSREPFTYPGTHVDIIINDSQDTILQGIQVDSDYLQWYLRNRIAIWPSGTDAWLGIPSDPIQSTGRVQIHPSQELVNYLLNKYGNLDKLPQVFLLSGLYSGRHHVFLSSPTNTPLRVRFLESSNQPNYAIEIRAEHGYVNGHVRDIYQLYNLFHPDIEKFLFQTEKGLHIKFYEFTPNLSRVSYFLSDIYTVHNFNHATRGGGHPQVTLHWPSITGYKIPFNLYKECLWTNLVPIDYQGDKNEPKFVLIYRIDDDTSKLYKPDGSFVTLTNSSITNSSININDYLLSFNQLRMITNIDVTNGDTWQNWYVGIKMNPGDWEHINTFAFNKGIKRIRFPAETTYTYFTASGQHKNYPADTDYDYYPFSRELRRADNNQLVDTNVLIHDLYILLVKRKWIYNQPMSENDVLINIPEYNKSNLTPSILFVHDPRNHIWDDSGGMSYWIEWGVLDAMDDYGMITITWEGTILAPVCKYVLRHSSGYHVIPRFIADKLFTVNFIPSSITPSFVAGEYVPFSIGPHLVADRLQRIEATIVGNIPADLELVDLKHKKVYPNLVVLSPKWRITTPEYIEYKTRTSNPILRDLQLIGYHGFQNDGFIYGLESEDYMYFYQYERPDYIVWLYSNSRPQTTDHSGYWWDPWIRYDYFEVDLSDLDIYFDILHENCFIFFEQNQGILTGTYTYPHWRVAKVYIYKYDRKNKKLYCVNISHRNIKTYRYMLYIYENPNMRLQTSGFTNFAQTRIDAGDGAIQWRVFVPSEIISLKHLST